MRVVMHGPPPWAPSGYGVQTRLHAKQLMAQGHEVAVSCFAGCYEDSVDWHGIRILSTGVVPYGNGVIRGNARRWDADVLILTCDAWTLDPRQFGKDIKVISWMPTDSNPLSENDKQWIQACKSVGTDLHIVSMSKFGQRMVSQHLAEVEKIEGAHEFPEPGHVPCAFDSRDYYPDAELGKQWRRDRRIPDDAFLTTIVGVNDNYPDRKAFTRQMQAFAGFAKAKPGKRPVVLYVHAEAQNPRGVNLVKVAQSLNLHGKILFADEFLRMIDGFDTTYMRGMYNAANLHSQCSRSEGFGVPVIESLACGTPVAATRAGSLTELMQINKARNGWLVNGDDFWSKLHNAWWVDPSITDIQRAYYMAHAGLAKDFRPDCVKSVAKYEINQVGPMWKEVLDALE